MRDTTILVTCLLWLGLLTVTCLMKKITLGDAFLGYLLLTIWLRLTLNDKR